MINICKLTILLLVIEMFSAFNKVKCVTLPTIPDDTFKITTYGAVSSESTDNTSAIQSTINACYSAGGGTVYVPAGTYLSGPLTMKNNTELYLASGATIKLLPYGTYPNSGTTDKNSMVGFIANSSVNNVKISGSGTIDGQGDAWWTAYNANESIARPSIIRFDKSNYIEISGITIINAPNVNITVGKTVTNTTIKKVTITAPSTSPNTDGIDVWSGTVDILYCTIAVGDDNIALDNNSVDITIKGCTFGIGHGCSIGSYASNVQNVTVDSCTFTGTDTGVRMKSSRDRGGVEQNLSYSNLTMVNVPTPISILSYYSKTPTISRDTLKTVTTTTPSWTGITFKNITATGATYAGNFWGLPEVPISDVVFDNVKISATYGMYLYNVKGAVFKNNSSITVTSGNAVRGNAFTIVDASSGTPVNTVYQSTIKGINLTSGKAIDTTSESLTIKATVLPSGAGSVSGTGSFVYGTNVSLTATPTSGYSFVKWTEVSPNNSVSANSTLAFFANQSRLLIANFQVATITNNIPETNHSMVLSPNPCKEKFSVKLINDLRGTGTLAIYNQSNSKIYSTSFNKTEQELKMDISTENFTPGVYIVVVTVNFSSDIVKLIVL